MSGNTLYDLAVSMLEATNPYSRPVEEMYFEPTYSNQPDVDENGKVSLCGKLKSRLGSRRKSSDARYADKINNSACVKEIAQSMCDYVEAFPAPFSYKQCMRGKFLSWIAVIQKRYHVEPIESSYKDLLKTSGERDTAIALLKELHSRDGVTREDLAARLGINPRAVQKDLRKLDRNLYEGRKRPGEGEYVPFYIGGQEVSVEIKEAGTGHTNDRKKRFYTPNTLHPIILQENLMEVGTLLQALSRNFYERESEISRRIAMNIWYQLSDYARERITRFVAKGDPDLTDMIRDLEDDTPDQHLAANYSTEREMLDEMELEGALSSEERELFMIKRGYPGRQSHS